MNETISMECICGTTHTFAAGVGTGTCAGCGLGLVLTEEVEVYDDGRDGMEDAVCDADPGDMEPADIDDDSGTNPYTGGWEDDGYDNGTFDD